MAKIHSLLLQVDPTQAITVAKDLGTGSPQMILSFVAVGMAAAASLLGYMLYHSWKAHLASVQECSNEKMELIKAIDGFKEVVKTALEAMKR